MQRMIGGLVLLLLSTCSIFGEQPNYESKDGPGFKVWFPSKPVEDAAKLSTSDGPIKINFLRTNHEGRTYWLVYNDYPADYLKRKGNSSILKSEPHGLIAKLGASVTSQKDVLINGAIGLDVRFSGPVLSGSGRLLLVDGRMYRMLVTTGTGEVALADVDAFVGSFSADALEAKEPHAGNQPASVSSKASDAKLTPPMFGRWDNTASMQGLEGIVYSFIEFDDGTGSVLYAGGNFHMTDSTRRFGVAKWDGTRWSRVGSGCPCSGAAMAVFDDGNGPQLFVGGKSISRQQDCALAKWDGDRWTTVVKRAIGANNGILSLEAFDDGSGPALFIGGSFTGLDLHSRILFTSGIAKYQRGRWSKVGEGLSSGTQFSLGGFGGSARAISMDVNDLVVCDDGRGPALYAGGYFTKSGNHNPLKYVARWDGKSWQKLGDGLMAQVLALTVHHDGKDSKLVAACETRSGTPEPIILGWDGRSWKTMRSTTNSVYARYRVHAVISHPMKNGPGLFALSNEPNRPRDKTLRFAVWDGKSWHTIGEGGLRTDVEHGFAVFSWKEKDGVAIYIGGRFDTFGGVESKNVVRWIPKRENLSQSLQARTDEPKQPNLQSESLKSSGTLDLISAQVALRASAATKSVGSIFLARAYHRLGNQTEYARLVRSSVDAAEKARDPLARVRLLLAIAGIQKEVRDASGARKSLDAAALHVELIQNKELQRKMYAHVAGACEACGDDQKAKKLEARFLVDPDTEWWAKSTFRNTLRYVQAKDFPNAEKGLEDLLSKNGSRDHSALAGAELAIAAANANRPGSYVYGYVTACERADVISRNDRPYLYSLLSEATAAIGNTPAAEGWARQIRKDEHKTLAWCNVASAHASVGRFEDAKRAFQLGWESMPEDALGTRSMEFRIAETCRTIGQAVARQKPDSVESVTEWFGKFGVRSIKTYVAIGIAEAADHPDPGEKGVEKSSNDVSSPDPRIRLSLELLARIDEPEDLAIASMVIAEACYDLGLKHDFERLMKTARGHAVRISNPRRMRDTLLEIARLSTKAQETAAKDSIELALRAIRGIYKGGQLHEFATLGGLASTSRDLVQAISKDINTLCEHKSSRLKWYADFITALESGNNSTAESVVLKWLEGNNNPKPDLFVESVMPRLAFAFASSGNPKKAETWRARTEQIADRLTSRYSGLAKSYCYMQIVRVLAVQGEFRRAKILAENCTDGNHRASALAFVAERLADTGETQDATDQLLAAGRQWSSPQAHLDVARSCMTVAPSLKQDELQQLIDGTRRLSLLASICLNVDVSCRDTLRADKLLSKTRDAGKAAYRVGDSVSVEWNGRWYAAKVIGIEPSGLPKIHYVGYSSSWDEIVPANRIRVK